MLVAAGGFLLAAAALVTHRLGWAAAAGSVGLLAATAARAWSRSRPGPMSHALRWSLHLPRGPHSPARLLRILDPQPGQTLLEVGPGIGIHALPTAAAIAPGGVLHAIDIQPAMVRDLERRAAGAGIRNIVAVPGDATKLGYPNATFDAIVLITVLGEIPDPRAALAEFRRVIRPGGRLVIGEMMIDPDFVSIRELRALAGAAGFALDHVAGPRFAYLACFRPVP